MKYNDKIFYRGLNIIPLAIYIANRVTNKNMLSIKVLLHICYLSMLQIIDKNTNEILAKKKCILSIILSVNQLPMKYSVANSIGEI